ncbi:MAG: multicopper oxidase family protein [candidate division NC10 bacterium]|nr:multicopper oxidase family protein [candidate division NC10 bacterium]
MDNWREVNELNRREFLRSAGLATAGMALGGSGLLVPRRAAAAGGVREIELVARETRWELAPGKVIKAMAYNGQVPGPTIRLREGERVRITLKNELAEPTTIHWHGVDVPNPMDGVPGITQAPVPPGGKFVYEFEARPAGTRWYHTHFAEHKQMDIGLVAPLIIEPADADPFPYDREYKNNMMGGGMGRMMEGMMGGPGMGGMMGGGMMGMGGQTPAYDTMTINGKAYPATELLHVRKGERVRLRLINASADHTHLIRLAGHRLKVTHTDGNPLVQPVEVDAVPIAPSERYDVLFVADNPGAWFLYCAEPGHPGAGEQVAVVYEGHEGRTPEAPIEGITDLSLWRYGVGRGRDVLHPPSGRERTFDLTLSGGMMGSDVWTINGRRYPNTDPLRLRKGDRVRVRFNNMSMEAHPMHLHGQSFKVLAVNGRRLSQPIVKDSVDVEAHMGSVDIEFTAHNPGDWFFHCHKPMHMEGGMIALAKIA